MSSLTKEASEKFNAIKQSNPGMTTNQALIASGAGSIVDLNNKLYDTGVSSSDVPAYSPERQIPDSPPPPQITPLDFGKTLLNKAVGIDENPNNLNSEKVLQLVRQGFRKPDFMQEYLNSGGAPPQYSVLSDSEYMEAYNTDQIPAKRDMEPTPQPGYDPLPQPLDESLPTQGSSPSVPDYDDGSLPDGSSPSVPDFINPATGQPYMPGDPNSPFYQGSLPPAPINPNINPPPINPGSPPIMSPGAGMGPSPMRPPISSFGPPMSPGNGMPVGGGKYYPPGANDLMPYMGPSPMVPSERLMNQEYSPNPMLASYNYYQPSTEPNDIMKRLLQQQQQPKRPLV
tara:strand:- start:104 stop:1129 length:1026 start_codon:yes stop_codon:yes gene_type:complete